MDTGAMFIVIDLAEMARTINTFCCGAYSCQFDVPGVEGLWNKGDPYRLGLVTAQIHDFVGENPFLAVKIEKKPCSMPLKKKDAFLTDRMCLISQSREIGMSVDFITVTYLKYRQFRIDFYATDTVEIFNEIKNFSSGLERDVLFPGSVHNFGAVQDVIDKLKPRVFATIHRFF
jgi:hypothetical protein